jgi:hypothetical protein
MQILPPESNFQRVWGHIRVSYAAAIRPVLGAFARLPRSEICFLSR